MALINEDLQAIKDLLQPIYNANQELKQRISIMEKDVTGIKLVLENEIRVNIQRVAERYLDLSRNLQEAMRPNTELEMLAVKVRMLEKDVRELKQKIS